MALLTIQILEGMERGRVLNGLIPPVTIGREEENEIQLNDERVSRFHAKIQEDGGRVILTDLESTNGTRVNGHPVQMHVLRIGDQIAIGRCLLLYGSADEIEERIQTRRAGGKAAASGMATIQSAAPGDSLAYDPSMDLPCLFPDGPPELPSELRPAQVAQLSDLLHHLHDGIRGVLVQTRAEPGSDAEPQTLDVDWTVWQRLAQIDMTLATWMRQLAGGTSEASGD